MTTYFGTPFLVPKSRKYFKNLNKVIKWFIGISVFPVLFFNTASNWEPQFSPIPRTSFLSLLLPHRQKSPSAFHQTKRVTCATTMWKKSQLANQSNTTIGWVVRFLIVNATMCCILVNRRIIHIHQSVVNITLVIAFAQTQHCNLTLPIRRALRDKARTKPPIYP